MYWNLFLKYLLLNFLFLLLIFTLTNPTSIQKNEETNLSTAEPKGLKPWDNYQAVQHGRKKREIFTLTTIIITVVWSMVVGPFVQMQLTSNIDLLGSFTETSGCVHRFFYNLRNGRKSWCMPKDNEITERRFLQDIYVTIFENISDETARLLEYVYGEQIGFKEYSPFDTSQKLTKREQLYFVYFKYNLIPIWYRKVPEALLNQEEDKQASKIHNEFIKLIKNKTDFDCDKVMSKWDKIKAENKKAKKSEYDRPNDKLLESFLICGCFDSFKNWNEISIEKFNKNLNPTECLEVMSAYNLMPTESEYVIAEQNEEKENEYDENTALLDSSTTTGQNPSVSYVKKIKAIQERNKRLKNIYQLFFDEVNPLDKKNVNKFIKMLTALFSFDKNSKISLVKELLKHITDNKYSRRNNYFYPQCDVVMLKYRENSIIDSDSQINYKTFEKLDKMPMLQELIKYNFELATESIYYKTLNEMSNSNLQNKIVLKHLKRIYLIIEVRKGIINVLNLFKKAKECQEEKTNSAGIKSLNEQNNGFCYKSLPSMDSKILDILMKFLNIFRGDNLRDSLELPYFYNFEELKNDFDDKMLEKLEKLLTKRSEEESKKKEEENNAKLNSPPRRSLDLSAARRITEPLLNMMGYRSDQSLLEEKGKQHINDSTNSRNNKVKLLSEFIPITVRKKRFIGEVQLIALGGALFFQQLYKTLFKKFDPLKTLIECIKNFDITLRTCRTSSEPEKKELEFMKKALKIVVERMSLETVVELRKFYEIYYTLHLKNIEEFADMMPSEYLSKLGVELPILHSYLIDCYIYNWDEQKQKLSINTADLTKLVNNVRKRCKPLSNFNGTFEVPKGLKPLEEHCSMITNILNGKFKESLKKKIEVIKSELQKKEKTKDTPPKTFGQYVDLLTGNDTPNIFTFQDTTNFNDTPKSFTFHNPSTKCPLPKAFSGTFQNEESNKEPEDPESFEFIIPNNPKTIN